jgi:RNA polymerase I-specific transcription initiation factor RRN7
VPLKILEHFPIQDLPPRPLERDDQDERSERLKQVQRNLIVQNPVLDQEEEGKDSLDVTRPGQLYRRYRNTDELPKNAKAFYKLAGTFPHPLILLTFTNVAIASEAGISVEKLTKAVFRMEFAIENWIVAERKRQLGREEYMV